MHGLEQRHVAQVAGRVGLEARDVEAGDGQGQVGVVAVEVVGSVQALEEGDRDGQEGEEEDQFGEPARQLSRSRVRQHAVLGCFHHHSECSLERDQQQFPAPSDTLAWCNW
jgi:hypothetical protein